MSQTTSRGKRSAARRVHHALRGLGYAFRHDWSVQLHVIIAVAVVLVALLVCLPREGFVLLFLSVGAVLAAEIGNSALEHLADRVKPARDPQIQRAKDVAAAAVLVVALSAVFVGLLLFLPPILSGTIGSCLLQSGNVRAVI